MEYALIVDTKDCMGCSACEVACKQEHDLPVGPRWMRVYSVGPQEIEGKMQLRYAVTHCMHCSQPLCKDACPVEAITKREDGIVLIDEELCTGCKDCVDACPLGVMQFDEQKGIAQKCENGSVRRSSRQFPTVISFLAYPKSSADISSTTAASFPTSVDAVGNH